jgi:hypothetical protein
MCAYAYASPSNAALVGFNCVAIFHFDLQLLEQGSTDTMWTLFYSLLNISWNKVRFILAFR